MPDLNTLWFILVFILLIGYAVLDGFDLGVGVLHLLARDDRERRLHLNSIGPVWDGNEVWLLTGGGALFAAFPIVYATVFSSFYLALMLLLLALIARAVAMEFRSKVEDPRWRRAWDGAFAFGSLVPAVLYGVAFGNILRGLPLEKNALFTGSFLGLLNPYAVLVGLFSLALFTLHGCLYLIVKSDGDLRARLSRYVPALWIAAAALGALAVGATVVVSPFLFVGLGAKPLFWVLAVLAAAGMFAVPLLAHAGRFAGAFTASAGAIIGLMGMGAAALFPRLVPSTIDLNNSLTISNASSTPRTLGVMLVIALVGMPVVIGYTAFIYRCFKGKTVLTEEGY